MKTVKASLKSPSLSGFFVTICDLILFLYFTSVLNRLTYIGYCRTNNYQKLIWVTGVGAGTSEFSNLKLGHLELG
jgi:hypothetical protein